MGSVPRPYLEALNDMIDRHSDREASRRNRVRDSVMLLQVVERAVALGEGRELMNLPPACPGSRIVGRLR